MRTFLKKMLFDMGFEVGRYNPNTHPRVRRQKLLRSSGIDVVFDVGANRGQFAMRLRRDVGFTGKIVSFEPVTAAFEALQRAASTDPRWEVVKLALGDAPGDVDINIAGNSCSSSVLGMLPQHESSAPHSKYVGKERIRVETLDAVFDKYRAGGRHVYLKIDTQGFEDKVLKGGEVALASIDLVQLEMSLVPLYSGEMLFPELDAYLTRRGYALVSLEGGFSDATTGRLLQVDGVYQRLSGVS